MAFVRMRAAGAVLAVALVAVALTAPAPQAAGTTCASKAGRVYQRGAISVHAVKRGRRLTFLLCSSRFRTPRVFHRRRYETDGEPPSGDTFKVRGTRLYFEDFVVATQREVLAWVDLRTARYREIHVPESVEYDEISAIADDGSILYVTIDERGHHIWVARAGGITLRKPRLAVNVVNGDMTSGTLTARGGVIRWKTAWGPPRSAPLSSRAVIVGSAPISCYGREQVYENARTRILYREVGHVERFYVCSAAIAKPGRFLEKTPYSSPPLTGFQEAGTTLSFTIEYECDECSQSRGVLDLQSGRLTRTELPPPSS